MLESLAKLSNILGFNPQLTALSEEGHSKYKPTRGHLININTFVYFRCLTVLIQTIAITMTTMIKK